jgi:hypothetical protein
MHDIIKQVLKEELSDQDKKRLISYFTKKWDKEKQSGIKPKFDIKEITKLGLRKFYSIIRLSFIDYYNKNYGDVYRAVLNDLTSNTFTTDDIEKLGIKVGTYDFKFQIYDTLVEDIPANGNIGKIKAYVKIIEGTVTAADGETYDLTDYNNPDLEFWWEVETEVDDLVDLFIEKKILSYGIILDNLVTNVLMYKNTDSINESIDENKRKNIANKFFNSLNLIPYHNKGYKMEYLSTKSGRFLFFSHRNSIYVDTSVYDMLYTILGDNSKVESFIYNELKNLGLKLDVYDLTYIVRDIDIGELDKYDEPGLLNNTKKLNEAKMLPKNKFAKAWLSKYNDLKKYISEDGRFIYLANNNGSIMVSLDTQLNETAVSYELIWSMLERYFTEKETRRKIIGWLLDRYHLVDMGYVYDESQDMMGKIDSSDILIEPKQITESNELGIIKNFFIKKWTREKSQGKTPYLTLQELKKMGALNFLKDIISLYSEFMNLDPNDTNSRSEIIKNHLLNNTFDENQITEMKESFDDGKIKVRFSKVEFSENENQVKNYIDLDIEFLVLSGSFYNAEEGETFNFSSTENPFDDFVQYFEFKEVIEQVVENFIFEIIITFGFDINKDFDYISVKW